MKSFLLSATALAILGVPALSVAQSYRPSEPNHQAQTQPVRAQPARPPAPPQPARNYPGPVMRQPDGPPAYNQRGPAPGPQPGSWHGQHMPGGPQPGAWNGQRLPNGPQQWRGAPGPAGPGYGQRDGQNPGDSRDIGYYHRGVNGHQYWDHQRGPDRDWGGRGDNDRGRDWGGRGDNDRGRDWWAGRRGFEGYEGPRNGYWYAPGRGYYYPGEAAYDFAWSLGAFVPYDLRSCTVDDPDAYGVPPAPYGYCWIFLDDRLVMIDLRSGLIVQDAGGY